MILRSAVDNFAHSAAGLRLRRRLFKGSKTYWEERYAKGGTSGAGSYGKQAEWKAEIVNAWVSELGVTSVIDLGCGDGNQLSLARYPRYLGLDRSSTAVWKCIERFSDDPTKSFLRYDPEDLWDPAGWLRGDLALSMEVIFHLVEDEVFDDYMSRLFDCAERFVVICSNDSVGTEQAPHEKHREFTKWVGQKRPEWTLDRRVDPPEDVDLMSSFFLYKRAD
ncbi:class I SAM-dependent methyltransferase [Actinokineospora fastidiosa]|uniref:class I SAM-dependent methyltransferase n=1 Tax=Actinokineospora fastidiosa TaxID=1816 RepID=UPI0016716471|nr:class I SAM-dependent methyltransferase [Actinokineospora fastidiosa]